MQLRRENGILLLLLLTMSMILMTNGRLILKKLPSPSPIGAYKALDWKGCLSQCFPICMTSQDANQKSCHTACSHGCSQSKGKGNTNVVRV